MRYITESAAGGLCRRKGGPVAETEVIEMAVRILKKQIPQKPVNPDEDYGTFRCPACGGLIYTEDRLEKHKFCLLCGQALDWNG